jgi:hypothetical protein
MFLPNESFFGLKGKCPECGHKFELYPLAAEVTDIQDPRSPAASDPSRAPAAPSDGTPDRPPDFEASLDPASPPPDTDDEFLNVEFWEGEEESLSGANPFHLEQPPGSKSVSPPEPFGELEPESQDSAGGGWNPSGWPSSGSPGPSPYNRLPVEDHSDPELEVIRPGRLDPAAPRNGSARPASPMAADQQDIAPVGPILIRCPVCEADVNCPADVELFPVVCPRCDSPFNLVNELLQQDNLSGGKTTGPFQLLEPIGRGPFGMVYRAYHPKLDRFVAVKIFPKDFLSAEEFEHFLPEARAVAQLRHPHILGALDVGFESDRLHIVSDFVVGWDLSHWRDVRKPTCLQAAALCATIAEAIHHAHIYGVFHRGLKPSNILLDGQDEPHILDFGLPHSAGVEMTLSTRGDVLGTPAYMPPEQVRGDVPLADARADVYSLGVILFELLTGERPFRGQVPMLMHQILEEDAPSPRTFHGAVPRDLETICLKCLEKKPARRFPSARALQEELERVTRNEPILSRPAGRLRRMVRRFRRHPFKAVFFVLGLALLVLGSAAATYFAIQEGYLKGERGASAP